MVIQFGSELTPDVRHIPTAKFSVIKFFCDSSTVSINAALEILS